MKRILVTTWLMVACHTIFCQVNLKRINESYTNENLGDILNDLRDKYELQIYFKNNWVSEVAVSAEFQNETPEDALKKLLRNTSFSVGSLTDDIFILFSREANEYNNYDVTVRGRVIDTNNDEPIPNAFIRFPEIGAATVSDIDGYYEIAVPAGTYLITVKSINSNLSRQVEQLYEDRTIDLQIFEKITELDDVVITSRSPDENIQNNNPGKLTLNLESIRKLPTLLGETDVSRIILSLPGVQTVGEGATGFNIRGGAIDQNLILLDGIPIYNSSHLLGFFSVFNPDLVNNFTVYKGNMPAEYGGRLSSVINVETRKTDSESFKFSAGIGPISNKVSVNIPVIKGKMGLTVGGRYSDPTWILKSSENRNINESSANFHDISLKSDFKINDKDVLTALMYRSHDFFDFGSDTSFTYQSTSFSLAWNHEFSKRLYSNFSVYSSDYEASLESETRFRESIFTNGIRTIGTRLNFDYQPIQRTGYRFGLELKNTTYDRGVIRPQGNESNIEVNDFGDNESIELGAYVENRFNLTNRLTITSGLRFSSFAIKENDLLVYSENQPRSVRSIVDTLNTDGFSTYYNQLEPRMSFNWRLTEDQSIKGGYTRSVQYEQLFSNSTASLPTDMWLPVSNNLEPSISDQFSVGYFKNFSENKWESSLEFYYKDFSQINLLKTGAEVLLNNAIETDIVSASGESYGAEFLLKKVSGTLTGWLSYFYARTNFVTNNPFIEDQINNGDLFRADFDRPHNINISISCELSNLWSFSSNFVYNTGRPVTVPNSFYELDGSRIFNVPERNNVRTIDNHRLDISWTYEGSNKLNKRLRSSLTFSIYNFYGRNNPFSIVATAADNLNPRTLSLTVLGNPIPSFTYNLKFE